MRQDVKAIGSPEWLGVLKEEHKAVSNKILPPKVKLFFHYLGGECGLEGKAAAEKAGYAFGATLGSKLKRKYPKTAQMVEEKYWAGLSLQPKEIHKHLSDIARDPTHRDRFRALELASRIHGMTSEKLQITMTRPQLLKAVDEEIASILAAEQEKATVN